LARGLSVGAGLALTAKRENLPYRSFVITGDGELAEGQVWEAANFAAYHKLDNLIAILDINRLAQSGETMFGYHAEEYASRFKAFGFETVTIDGHDYNDIDNALEKAVSSNNGKPFAIVAKTMKGKGHFFFRK
jgi:transketolase